MSGALNISNPTTSAIEFHIYFQKQSMFWHPKNASLCVDESVCKILLNKRAKKQHRLFKIINVFGFVIFISFSFVPCVAFFSWRVFISIGVYFISTSIDLRQFGYFNTIISRGHFFLSWIQYWFDRLNVMRLLFAVFEVLD